MTLNIYHCSQKCCKIETAVDEIDSIIENRRRYNKAGSFIYDPKEKRVVLVQSRGQLWGPPKGTLEYKETWKHCAVREVKEETGIDISESELDRFISIKNRAVYYYIEKDFTDLSIQNIPGNDATGITWIKVTCLEDLVKNGNIVLNHHCEILFKKILNISFHPSPFFKVKRKHKHSKKHKKEDKNENEQGACREATS